MYNDSEVSSNWNYSKQIKHESQFSLMHEIDRSHNPKPKLTDAARVMTRVDPHDQTISIASSQTSIYNKHERIYDSRTAAQLGSSRPNYFVLAVISVGGNRRNAGLQYAVIPLRSGAVRAGEERQEGSEQGQ